MNITINLAQKLISTQFPKYKHLSITPVESNGIDNQTFHLGDEMLIRMPSSQAYAAQVEKEQHWLPQLAPHLSITIPFPIAMGQPSTSYPWHWSIYKWIPGQSANLINKDLLNLENIATSLAQFLQELHQIESSNGPVAGLHNYHRGAHLSVYDDSTRSNIKKLEHIVDTQKALSIWNRAISSQWEKPPVWIHGDLSTGNIIIKNNHLNAVIDFGCMGIGDPACDLIIAWTFFTNKSRELFKNSLNLDKHTWSRAQGWALWKSLYELSIHNNTRKQLQIIDAIFKDYNEV